MVFLELEPAVAEKEEPVFDTESEVELQAAPVDETITTEEAEPVPASLPDTKVRVSYIYILIVLTSRISSKSILLFQSNHPRFTSVSCATLGCVCSQPTLNLTSNRTHRNSSFRNSGF